MRHFTPSPCARAITHGFAWAGSEIKKLLIHADFLVARHSTVKRSRSVSKYFPSSLKQKLSVTAYNLSQIPNNKYIICIK